MTLIFNPMGMALDADGNLYIQTGNSSAGPDGVFCKLDTGTGTLATVSADVGSGPTGSGCSTLPLTVDDAGNLFIGDFDNELIRKIDKATSAVTTVADLKSLGFNGSVETIAVDPNGDIYFVGIETTVALKVSSTTGQISTIAGTGTYGNSGDGDLAVNAEFGSIGAFVFDANGNLYLSDSAFHVIRRIDQGTGKISTLAGNGHSGFTGDGGLGTAAELAEPEGLAVDGSGNLYIADSANNVVRKVELASNTITTIAGTGTAGYSGDGGPATSAQLSEPLGVAVDGDGNLYVSDSKNDVIRKVDRAGKISTVAGSYSSFHGTSSP